MSLVAYGASDDSETSDVEESETPKPTESGDSNNRALADDGKISDEDDYVPTARIQSAAHSSSVNVSSTKEIELNRVYVNAPSTLNDLPAPKSLTSAPGGEEGEDELEEEVKPKASQLADAPLPPSKKVRQPARIVLPALKKNDEEESGQKKPKNQPAAADTSGSRSGLFALLPAPTHSSVKQARRPLIPYTLTKRPAAASKTTATTNKPASPSTTTTTDTDPLPFQKHQSAFNALTGYESDSDEEEGSVASNFFSFRNEAESKSASSGMSVVKNSAPSLEPEGESQVRTSGIEASTSGELTAGQSASSHSPLTSKLTDAVLESPVSSSLAVSAPTSKDSSVTAAKTQDASVRDSSDDDDDDDDDENKVSSTGVPLVNQDAPLTFSSSMQSGRWSAAPLASPMLPELYAAHTNSGASSYWQRQQHYAQDYGAVEEQEASSSSSSSNNIQQFMEDEQFLRMSGKRKLASADIQIVDANVDDCVDPSELMKGISEESSYQPHRKKDNMPSMQQKRKKQITYLAFQAKERELELKNAWSQNRMTKNQARSKYGF